MAKVDTDAQAQAVQTLLGGLSLKRKQELIERNDRLRFQFLQTQKMPAAKAREAQLNAFLANVVAADKKVRDLVFNAWVKDNAAALGDVPEFPERYKAGAEEGDEEGAESDLKDATAAVKKWIKTTDADVVAAYLRVGPYEFPSKVLTAAKKPKAKEAPAAEAEAGEAAEAAAPVAGGVSEAVVAELKRELEAEKDKLQAKLAKAEEETAKFKRLLEENKDKRKSELAEAQDKARAELQTKQADWQRVEAQLRKEIADLQKARQETSDKVGKARDELVPLRQQLERAEKEARKATNQLTEALAAKGPLEEEIERLQDRVKVLESAQQQLVTKEKQLQRMEKLGASAALASSDNIKIWEESQAEQEVKDALTRTFNLDNFGTTTYEHGTADLHEVWKQLIRAEEDQVDRFFALPFDELQRPSDEFRELVTSFIELKDSLVAREQLSLLLNFVGNRFLEKSKQKDGPTFVLLHGSGGNEKTLLDLARKIAPNATFLGVRGRVEQDGINRWYRRLTPTSFDQKDIRDEAKAFADFLTDTAAQNSIDLKKAVFLGYSNGANLVAAVSLLHPDLVRKAVLLRAMPVLDKAPVADLKALDILTVAGKSDVTYSPFAPALAKLLRGCGANVEARTIDSGHNIGEEDARVVREWLTAELSPQDVADVGR